MTPSEPREHVAETPIKAEGILYARLALGPHRNFVYVVADPGASEAVVIDPAFDVRRILDVLRDWECTLKAALFTHNHWDHVEGASAIQEATGCPLHLHETDALPLQNDGLDVVPIPDGHVLGLGAHTVVAHHTPGHTAGGLTYQIGKRLFTGDFLFIDQAGRTDLPSGSKRTMWDSLQRFKETFADELIICPGHDYGTVPEATVGDQKRRNSALMHTEYEAFAKEWYLVAY